jgi:hypothetical protein
MATSNCGDETLYYGIVLFCISPDCLFEFSRLSINFSCLVEGEKQGNCNYKNPFGSSGECDVVTVELKRRHGQDGVMRVRVAGKAFVRDMTALPRDGMLYPAACFCNRKQSYSMVAAP